MRLIQEELEERLMQALTLIDCLLNNPTEELKQTCRAFIKENDPVQQVPYYTLQDIKGEDGPPF